MLSAHSFELLALGAYLSILILIGVFSYKKTLSSTGFMIGDRSMNYWLTALSAHGSDMSSWLFMAYPSVIFLFGPSHIWTAIGLLLFMYLNWKYVAPKLRATTEQYNSLTLSSFFESSLIDTSGLIRIFTTLMLLFFYIIYVSAGLTATGFLGKTLFSIPHSTGVFLGAVLIIPYVVIGGFRTVARIDLFQGLFLMGVIIFVPIYLFPKVGSFSGIIEAMNIKEIPKGLFRDASLPSIINSLLLMFGWGLGYFGQPHIVTKFMGITNVSDMKKSQWVGMSWMTVALIAATVIGIIGIAFFQNGGLDNPELVFIQMVKESFHPFLIGIMLCAVLAMTINTMGSQVLVLTTGITEDIYKKMFRKEASSTEPLFISRLGVLIIAVAGFMIAYLDFSSMYALVLYAWSGIGASFGPLLICCLYTKKVNKYGAWVGILSGGIAAAIWPYFNKSVPSLPIAFSLSGLLILLVSAFTAKKGSQ